MELMRVQRVRFIAINSGVDSADQSTLEFAPFINIMSEWYAKDISKKRKKAASMTECLLIMGMVDKEVNNFNTKRRAAKQISNV